jgi:3-oxoacyl-[acyl-carrier-protein] synthase-3
MSLGIKAIASYIPVGSIDNVEQGVKFAEDENFIRSKIGALKLPIKNQEQETSDLAVAAVNALIAQYPDFDVSCLDALVVVTQNGDGEGLPHTSAIVQQKAGLPTTVAAFDVSLGCSGYVYGLYVLKGFLQATGLRNGLLITADPYSKVVDRSDRVTSLLFGDAATATWIGENPRWALGESGFGTDGGGAEHLHVENGTLNMNGRQVFNFAAMKVAPHIQQILQKAKLGAEDIDAFCVHQGSAAIVDAISRRFGAQSNRFVLDIEETGNTISSSIPLLLEKHAFSSDWKRVVVSGFGVGLSWATALLERDDYAK